MKNLKKITVTLTALSGAMFSNSAFGASNSDNSDTGAKTTKKSNTQTKKNKKTSNSKKKSSSTLKESTLKATKSTSSNKIAGKITARPATEKKSRNKNKKLRTKSSAPKSKESSKIIKKINKEIAKKEINVNSKKIIEDKKDEIEKAYASQKLEDFQKPTDKNDSENNSELVKQNEEIENDVKVEKPVTEEKEKEEERVLSTASPVSTQNYRVSYIEINSIDTHSNGKLTKSTKMDISFGVELEVKNPEIELENVKVYLVTPGKREKLIIDSKVPKERTVRSENEGLFEAWITNVGMKSNIKNFDNEKIDNRIRWNGTSGIMGSISFKDLIKTPAEKNEMDKKSFFEKIKSLVSPGNQYSYLFKFVIKAKDKEEELIYQPAIFNVKLMGAKKI